VILKELTIVFVFSVAGCNEFVFVYFPTTLSRAEELIHVLKTITDNRFSAGKAILGHFHTSV
jgi:hypothetical protein